MNTECEKIQAKLAGLIGRTEADTGQPEIDAHLRECHVCRMYLERLEVSRIALSRLAEEANDEERIERIALRAEALLRHTPATREETPRRASPACLAVLRLKLRKDRGWRLENPAEQYPASRCTYEITLVRPDGTQYNAPLTALTNLDFELRPSELMAASDSATALEQTGGTLVLPDGTCAEAELNQDELGDFFLRCDGLSDVLVATELIVRAKEDL